MKKDDVLGRWFVDSGVSKWPDGGGRRRRFTEPQFAACLKAIGQLLLAWNDLHERLLTLFVPASGADTEHESQRPAAVWHSVRSDHARREMLRAALSKLPNDEFKGREKLVTEITWILDMADKLEGRRDDAVHTPLIYAAPVRLKNGLWPGGVFTETGYLNPRALRIRCKQQNVLIEYRYAYRRILVLRDYVVAIEFSWRFAQLPWPDRPSLPDRQLSRPSKGRAARRSGK